jgi:hypothetical protein
VTTGTEMVIQLRMLEGRVEYLQDSLVLAQQRNAFLKVRLDSMRNTLKQARRSRDGWKTKAQARRKELALYRQRVYYAREQRDHWKFRALSREVEENPTPNGKGHLARVSL